MSVNLITLIDFNSHFWNKKPFHFLIFSTKQKKRKEDSKTRLVWEDKVRVSQLFRDSLRADDDVCWKVEKKIYRKLPRQLLVFRWLVAVSGTSIRHYYGGFLMTARKMMIPTRKGHLSSCFLLFRHRQRSLINRLQ